MPTEVAMAYRVLSPPAQLNTAETKSGPMSLIAPNGRCQAVNVVVYHTTLEHFAVVYPQKKICRPLGVVNIRTTKAERLETQSGFTLRQNGFDAPMALTFLCAANDLDAWMRAFERPPHGPPGHGLLRHQSSLPCVEEGDVDDDEF